MKLYSGISLVVLSMFFLICCGEELGPPMQWSDSGFFLEEEDASILELNDATNMSSEDASNTDPEVQDASDDDSGEDPGVYPEPADAGPEQDDAAIIIPDDPEPEDPEPEDPLAWVPDCQTQPCPNVIDHFPYVYSGDTRSGSSRFDAYSCQPGTSEAGPEELFVFRLTEPGVVIVGLTEPSGGDVDVHLLTDLSDSACLSRSDKGVSNHLAPGIYYISMDTYQSSSNAGAYSMVVTFLPDSGKCGLQVFDMDRVNDGGEALPMPATGKVVKEAHLVTVSDQADNGSTSWWPASSTEFLTQHKARTAQQTGIEYTRTESWAPAGEGGCEYGQGSTGRAVPDEAEPWYICMYWKGDHKPAKGTRYLVVNPATGKTIVAAAGYETGPGDLSNIGGAVEEIHYLMGTSHKSVLTFGELIDQSLPYGEIDCD